MLFSFIRWGTKLTPFSEKSLKKVGRLSTFMFQLNYKNPDNIIGGTVGAERKQTDDAEWINVLIKFRKLIQLEIQGEASMEFKCRDDESVSSRENYYHMTVLYKSIEDLQFWNLYQRFLNELLQNNYIECHA